MRKTIILLLVLSLMAFLGNTQSIANLDYVSSFNDGLAAIKKGNQWAFVNPEGNIAIPFRSDLVTTQSQDGTYPVFKEGRCIISREKEGILYFGYIDTTGKEVVEPQFLNASNYNNGLAIVLKLETEELGKNTLLGKNVVNYKYFEVALDGNGNIISYLTQEGTTVVLDKKSLKKPPKINSKLISENLCAVSEEDKWVLKKIR